MSGVHLDLLTEPRAEIINLLKRRGPLSADTFAGELGISKVAVRRHLERLEIKGLVTHSAERCERGRPRHVYRLTATGDGLFPDTSASFACSLLEQVSRTFGSGAVDRLLTERTDLLISLLRDELRDLDFDARIRALARYFNDCGYVTEIVTSDDGAYVVIEHNCPTYEVAERYPKLCEEELRLYASVSGADVHRNCRRTTGADRCEYRIVPVTNRRSLPVLGDVGGPRA
jgi:predicted ArsR family transcriptional regulator